MVNDNTIVTVTLTPKSVSALEDAAILEGHTMTDVVNNAIQLYCLIIAERKLGERVFIGKSIYTASELKREDWS